MTNLTLRAISQIAKSAFFSILNLAGVMEVCSVRQHLVQLGKEPRKDEKTIGWFWRTSDSPPHEITHRRKKLYHKNVLPRVSAALDLAYLHL